MKTMKRIVLLRITATAAINAIVYASAVLLRFAAFRTDGGYASLALFLSAMLLANIAGVFLLDGTPRFILNISKSGTTGFLAFMLNIDDGARFLARAAAWSLMLAPMTVGVFIYGKYGVLRVLYELLPVAAGYIISFKHSRVLPAQIMSNTAAFTGFFVLAACLELPLFIDRLQYLRPWLFGVSFFFIFVYLVVKNQEDIDSNIYNKRHIERSILPKNLRKFNTMMVCSVFFIILLLFNFKMVVIAAVNLLGRFIVFIITGILMIIDKMMQFFSLSANEAANAYTMPEFVLKPPSPIVNLISNIIKYLILSYLSYKLLIAAVRRFPAFLRKIGGLILRIFSIKRREKTAEESEYIDETEIVRPARNTGARPRTVRRTGKRFKSPRLIADPSERIRHMYSAVLQMLPLMGIKPDRSDTTMEIAGKIPPGDVSSEFSPFTLIYNKVRYGGVIPDGEMAANAEGHYGRAADAIRRKQGPGVSTSQ